ncbi:hypothetical protein [Pseudomonas sp. NPDC090208]|uniref:hypothetical protein n=1 Tax=Pseudomonas sp. NPDC090208 TaxID=3364478 RepID=UPI0037F66326
MIYLVEAQLDHEGSEPVRAFTTLEAARAFLVKIQKHNELRPHGVMSDADWEIQHSRWVAEHPAPDYWMSDRFDVNSVPLDNEVSA